MANDFSLSVVGERDEFFEDFATIVEPPFEEEELEQREMRRNAFWREGDGTAEHGDAVVALGWAREVDDETAFFEQNGLFFGRRCRIERRLQERDDVFWLVIGSRNASQFVNRRLAHVIGFESLEIADIGEFFVSGVFEDAGDTELNGAFTSAVARAHVRDFVVVSGDDIFELIGERFMAFEMDVIGMSSRADVGFIGLGESLGRRKESFSVFALRWGGAPL